METYFFLETLVREKIAEARAEAARERLLHAAGQPDRRRGDGGALCLLRNLWALLFRGPSQPSKDRALTGQGR